MNRDRDAEELKAIGMRLKAARLALGLSQKEVYEALGVGASTWHHWESGKRTPDPLVMAKLQKLHGISLDWIFAADPSNLPHRIVGKTLQAAS